MNFVSFYPILFFFFTVSKPLVPEFCTCANDRSRVDSGKTASGLLMKVFKKLQEDDLFWFTSVPSLQRLQVIDWQIFSQRHEERSSISKLGSSGCKVTIEQLLKLGKVSGLKHTNFSSWACTTSPDLPEKFWKNRVSEIPDNTILQTAQTFREREKKKKTNKAGEQLQTFPSLNFSLCLDLSNLQQQQSPGDCGTCPQGQRSYIFYHLSSWNRLSEVFTPPVAEGRAQAGTSKTAAQPH